MPSRAPARRRAHGGLGRALLLRGRSRSSRRATGRLPRYTWRDAYAELREKLDALGRRLGGEYRVLVDANQHVDREAAARSGVGFYGKNTLLITRRHGSWVVLGTLVTDAELEPTPPLETDCGACRLCIDACPTGALDEPGVLDATRCLSYWTQAPAAIPRRVPRGARGPASTAATSARTSARGTAGSRSGARTRRSPTATSRSSRSSTGSRPRPPSSAAATTGSTFPRNDGRATCAGTRSSRLGNAGGPPSAPPPQRVPRRRRPELLREHAAWAVERIEERHVTPSAAWQRDVERWMVVGPDRRRRRWRCSRSALLGDDVPAGLRGRRVDHDGRARRRRGRLRAARRWLDARTGAGSGESALVALAFDFGVVSAYVLVFAFQPGTPIRQLLLIPVFEGALRFGLARRRRRSRSSCAPVYVALRVAADGAVRRAASRSTTSRSRVGVGVICGLIVGWLVNRLWRGGRRRRARAEEAERLRDELGRRVDVLEAAEPLRPRARLVARARARRSARSSASCAASSRSTGRRSCSPRTAPRR